MGILDDQEVPAHREWFRSVEVAPDLLLTTTDRHGCTDGEHRVTHCPILLELAPQEQGWD